MQANDAPEEGDPHDCGSPGHDCQGGACLGGVCQELLLAPPTAPSYPPRGIVVDSARVYWDNSGVYSCALNGCNGMPTAYWPNGAFGLAGDGANLYWFDYSGAGGGLLTCPYGNICAQPKTLMQNPMIGLLATLGGSVYWADQREVMTCNASGCKVFAPPEPGGTLFIATGPNSIVWTAAPTVAMSQILTCPPSSCTTPQLLATTTGFIGGLTVDVSQVYWTTASQVGAPGQLLACPVNGCPSGGPIVLATVPANGGDVASNGPLIAWIAGNQVLLCTAGDACPDPTVLATDSAGPLDLTMDSTSVYWTTTDGAVHKRAF